MGTAAAVAALVAAAALPTGAWSASTPKLTASDHTITWPQAVAPHVPQNQQDEPSVAINPTNGLNQLVGANDTVAQPDCGVDPSNGGSVCQYVTTASGQGVYRSVNGGSSWTLQSVDWSAAGVIAGSDPNIAFGPKPDGHGGFSYGAGARAYYSAMAVPTGTFSPAIAVAHSDDGGGSWAPPTLAAPRASARLFNDKDALWVDNNPASPHFGNVYVAWSLFAGPGTPNNSKHVTILVSHSADGGQTWSDPLAVSRSSNTNRNSRQGSAIRTDPGGRVIVTWWEVLNGANVIEAAVSADGGATFANPVQVGPIDGWPDPLTGTVARNDPFPSVDVDQSTGAIYVAWPNYPAAHGTVRIARSIDHGVTWTVVGSVDIPGRSPFQPSIAVARSGIAPTTSTVPGAIVLGFSGIADVPSSTPPINGATNFVPLLSFSLDGGATWSTPTIPGGVKPSDPAGASGPPSAVATIDFSQQFLGDYSTVSPRADGTGFAFAYTSTTEARPCAAIDAYRTGTGPLPNIYTACSPQFGNSNIHVAEVTVR